MMFFLFFRFFSHAHGACLEFPNSPLRNNCSVVESATHNTGLERYYPECLQCHIQTWTESDDVKVEGDNQCTTHELRCIQLKFGNQKIFEDFFRESQSYVYQLFFKENGTDQNTLHIILEEHTLEVISREYINETFQLEPPAYRVLIFELSLQNTNVQIQQDLATIARLAIKIILHCGDQMKSSKTVYIIDNQQITLEGKEDNCLSIFPSLPTTVPSTSLITASSAEVLFVSQEKYNDLQVVLTLAACVLLCAVITSMICYLKSVRKFHRKSSTKDGTTSELSVSEDISLETSFSSDDKPKLSLKAKQPKRGMRAIQLLHDDI